ncbi:MAG: carboxymuconolactone decarboxylase family protein [Chloroflexota bacterium]|nr:carboxymuconolactone decarboxylase family protein [Chloroflexota bacterium]
MEKRVNPEENMAALGMQIPKVMGAFVGLDEEATKDGAISAKMKELIALALSVALRCEYCIKFHVPAAVKQGLAARKFWRQRVCDPDGRWPRRSLRGYGCP